MQVRRKLINFKKFEIAVPKLCIIFVVVYISLELQDFCLSPVDFRMNRARGHGLDTYSRFPATARLRMTRKTELKIFGNSEN